MYKITSEDTTLIHHLDTLLYFFDEVDDLDPIELEKEGIILNDQVLEPGTYKIEKTTPGIYSKPYRTYAVAVKIKKREAKPS